MRKIIYILAAFLLIAGISQARTIEIMLGDMDDFNYEGIGSEDDVYVDPDWAEWGEGETNNPKSLFDTFELEQWVLFSFHYDLVDNENIDNASLIIALKSVTSDESYHSLILGDNNASEVIRPTFYNIGWEPISATETSIREIDLSNVTGTSLLSYMEEGILNIAINRNIAVDYAILNIQTVPEPTTVSLVILGFGIFRKFNHC